MSLKSKELTLKSLKMTLKSLKMTLKAFKMACLNYQPSAVAYNNRLYTRKEALKMLGTHLGQSEDTGVPTLTENKRPCSTRRYRRSSRHILDASCKILLDEAEIQTQRQLKV